MCAVCSAPSACPSTSPICAADYSHHAVEACSPYMHADLMPAMCAPDSFPCAWQTATSWSSVAGCLHTFGRGMQALCQCQAGGFLPAGGSSPGRGRALPQELSHRDAGQAGLWSAHGRRCQQLRRARQADRGPKKRPRRRQGEAESQHCAPVQSGPVGPGSPAALYVQCKKIKVLTNVQGGVRVRYRPIATTFIWALIAGGRAAACAV